MPVRGDFAKLQKLSRDLKKLGYGFNELNQNLAEEAIDLIKEGFATETDPYGKPWAGLKYRSGKILQDTGRLRSSFKVAGVTRRGFRVNASANYAAFHQEGTSRGLPARRMVPDGRLPAEWKTAFVKAADVFMKRWFR